MLKRHKNGFLDLIKKRNLDPSSFTAEDRPVQGTPGFVIELRGTPLRFSVLCDARDFHTFRCKFTQFAAEFHESELVPSGLCTISDIYGYFAHWLSSHVQEYVNELMLPDLWQQMELQKPLLSGTALDQEDTAPFSEEEKAQLRLSINELRLLIVKTFEPSENELQVIGDRLDYLSGALDRLNRIDWRGLAISTMLSMSLALGLDTEKGKVLFELFKQIFTKVVHLLQ